MPDPTGRLTTMLVTWYGLYQATHVLVNVRGLSVLLSGGVLNFPVPPPPEGWSADTVHLMVAIGFADLAGAVLALVFVYGYFRRSPWGMWLGTVALTISIYAELLYLYWTLARGALTSGSVGAYLFINISFIPIAALFTLFVIWGISGRLQPAEARRSTTL